MNIGLEVLRTNSGVVFYSEQLLGEYVSCENLCASTERFTAYGDQLFETFDNVISLRRTAKKFNSQESLNVINDLVAAEFGGAFSVRASEEAAESIWTKIKNFFARIWDWIKTFFNRILNFFMGAENRLNALKGKLIAFAKKGVAADGSLQSTDGVKKGLQPWRPLVELASITICIENPKKATAKGKAAKELAQLKAATSEVEAMCKVLKSLTLKESTAEIKTVDASVKFIEALVKAIGEVKNTKRDAEAMYQACKGVASQAEKENAIDKAKEVMKTANAVVKCCNIGMNILMRIAAHTMAHCKPVAKKSK